MDEEFSLDDPTQLLDSASDFAHHPGSVNEAAVKDFLHRFPLPVIIRHSLLLPLKFSFMLFFFFSLLIWVFFM